MKKIMFSCLLFINVNICLSQDNISLFAEDQTLWSIEVFSDNPNEPDEIYFLKIDGQILINDTAYFQIKKSENFSTFPEDWTLSCHVRVDEDSILYLRTIDNIEKRIFNYKLDYGESEECWLYDYFAEEFISVDLTVQDVEFITNSSNTYKKWTVVNNLGEEWPNTTWIQNIGCLEGVLMANRDLVPITGRKDVVLCAWFNEMQIYSNENYENCGLVLDININTKKAVVSLYPNPTYDKICINSSDSSLISETFEIFNSQGKKVLAGCIKSSNMIIYLDKLCSGIYILKIRNVEPINIIKL
ncbi:MAG: T9SS type A sorting domain-containing protein [Bacteroidales bacterium]|nr:T9SS type A sorting domain-containing protein [Bacteroidales bacterium]